MRPFGEQRSVMVSPFFSTCQACGIRIYGVALVVVIRAWL